MKGIVMKDSLLSKVRQILLLILFDTVSVIASLYFTCIALNVDFSKLICRPLGLILLVAITVMFASLLRLYHLDMRHAGFDEMVRIFLAMAFSFGVNALINLPLKWLEVPQLLMMYLILLHFYEFSRFSVRALRAVRIRMHKNKNLTRVMIVGAGKGGIWLVKELQRGGKLLPVCMIDDNVQKKGMRVYGVPVVGGRNDIVEAASRYHVERIMIAIPSADRAEINKICQICTTAKCRVQIMPGVQQMMGEADFMKTIRDVDINDLLGREPISVNSKEVFAYIEEKCVLITGGGGSIGSELCRQIAAHNPSHLVIFDIYENNAYEIEQELRRTYPNLRLSVLIGSVRERARVDEVFRAVKPQIVFHAAAHKHVPLMEASPAEAVKNNVFGTVNVAHAAREIGAERFVMISTDKAVNPTNVMGATKRICEMIVQTFAAHSTTTDYVAVRFGNVLGSNGSVIPLFKRQIQEGGPVTVTHKDIIRYFMTIPEACSLVLQAGAYAKGGEIFVLDMGEPVKILSLAENLIRLSGYEPYTEIPIKFTGLRPGEKLYEELLMEEEGMRSTANKKIYIGKPLSIDESLLRRTLEELHAAMTDDTDHIRSLIKQLVPTYRQGGKQ